MASNLTNAFSAALGKVPVSSSAPATEASIRIALDTKYRKLFDAITKMSSDAQMHSPDISVQMEAFHVSLKSKTFQFVVKVVANHRHGIGLEITLYDDDAWLRSRATGLPFGGDTGRFAVADMDELIAVVSGYLADSLKSLTGT